MSDDPGGHARELRSFGRRRGRKLSPRQARLQSELLPRLAIDTSVPAADAMRGLRAQGFSEVWLEIGFGGGEHLLLQARQNPNVAILGAEPFEDGVVKVLAQIEDDGLANIRVHADDVRPVLRWLPSAQISRAFVLFPDPWPKTRHRKRRLVNSELLAELARVMRPGAELRIGTDIGDYARTMLAANRCVPELRWLAAGPDDWRRRPDDWPETRYEQKAHREGRRCYFLRFERR